jgi:hypothetical protein
MELQERILNRKEIDLDVKNAMETLFEEELMNLQNDLHDWKIEEIDGRRTIFYKEKELYSKAIEGANTMRPFAQCSMDLITDLPLVEGYDSIWLW